jgi:hypothetical protein
MSLNTHRKQGLKDAGVFSTGGIDIMFNDIIKAIGIWLVLNHFRLNYEEYAEAIPYNKASFRYVYNLVKLNRGDI